MNSNNQINKRSNFVKNNIIISSVLKIIGIFISFILVPITLTYLGDVKYGIWTTLISIISWIGFFDIGLGNGLRNKLTESLAKEDINSSREYIATTYFSIFFIVIIIGILLTIIIPILDWQKIFKVNNISNNKLMIMFLITSLSTLFNFLLSIYNQLYYAIQKSWYTGIGQLINNIFILIGVIIISRISYGNLTFLALVYSISMITTSIVMTILFFRLNKELIPKLSNIKIEKIKDITCLGIKFFVLQIAFLIIYTTDNLIITQILGPEFVSAYNITNKLFSIIQVSFAIIQAPLWSAYTDAYYRKDYFWIKKVLKRINLVWLVFAIGTVGIIVISPIIFKVWINNSIDIPRLLVILTGLYMIINTWSGIYSSFLNGIGKISLSMYMSIVGCVVNIPLSILLAKNMGAAGVILATIISVLPGTIQSSIQSFKIIKKLESSVKKY